MKTNITLAIILLSSSFPIFGQPKTIIDIQKLVESVEEDPNLIEKEFPIDEVYQYLANDGGFVKVYFDNNGLKKFQQESLFPFGKLSTTIYFDSKRPIKIIEKEENYNVLKDQIKNKDSPLKEVFQVEIYIFNWEQNEMKVIKKGKRRMSEEYCAVYDFEPLMELAAKLIKK